VGVNKGRYKRGNKEQKTMTYGPVSLKEAIARFNQSDIFENIEKEFNVFQKGLDGNGYAHKKASDLSVIVSFSEEKDGQIWKHVSMARRKRMPTYDEIEEFKKLFCGENTYALIIFPPKKVWVSLHPYCVHLWEPMEKYPLPEFSGLVGGIRSI
jgi:hypothetical protein